MRDSYGKLMYFLQALPGPEPGPADGPFRRKEGPALLEDRFWSAGLDQASDECLTLGKTDVT